MDNLEKVKRHLGKPIQLTLKNEDGTEDVFYLKSLNIGQQAILMELTKRIQQRPKIKINDVETLELTKEDITEMFNLMLDIVKNSFGDISEEMAIEFTNINFDQLFNKLEELIPNRQSNELTLAKKKAEEIRDAARIK